MIFLVIYLIIGILVGILFVGGFRVFESLFFSILWPFIFLSFLQDTYIEYREKRNEKIKDSNKKI